MAVRRLVARLVLTGLITGSISGCAPSEASVVPTTAASPTVVASPTVAPGTAAQSPASRPPASPAPALWEDATARTIGATAEWSNKVELADLDADGDVDILFANGGLYESAGPPEPTRVFINDGHAAFTDRSSDVLGDALNLARVVKVRDVDGNGLVDIVIGNTYQTQSRLFLGRGGLAFEEVTDTHLPKVDLSVGDVELGDVDSDGDLDMILADWGPGNPMQGTRAAPRLWVNDGKGRFTEAKAGAIPDHPVGFSWDIEFIDVDNDLDLDIMESCKMCSGGLLLHNDGTGSFVDASDQLPQFGNDYEFEPMDVDGDGFLDVVTINDGENATEHLFLADGKGGFSDATTALWPAAANPSADDNVVVFLDAESDGDPDFLIGSLDRADRLLVNDGTGRLSMDPAVFSGPMTQGTLGMAVADLDGDGRLDVVQAQGEAADPDAVHLGVAIPPDTAAPVVPSVVARDGSVVARVTDHSSGMTALREVTLEGPGGAQPMTWYGESLWRASVDGNGPFTVCATDAAGNRGCSAPIDAGS